MRPDALLMILCRSSRITDAEEDPTVLTDKFRPQTGPSVIAHAAATCNQILRSRCVAAALSLQSVTSAEHRSHKAATKRIYLVTDIEDPFPLTDENDDSRGRRHQAQTLAKDCAEMQYIITPFFVVHEGGSFDVTKFFADFLFHHTALDVETAKKHFVKEEEGSGHDWAHFLSVASVRPPPKRSAFSIPFILGDGLEISILGCDVSLYLSSERRTRTAITPSPRRRRAWRSRSICRASRRGRS